MSFPTNLYFVRWEASRGLKGAPRSMKLLALISRNMFANQKARISFRCRRARLRKGCANWQSYDNNKFTILKRNHLVLLYRETKHSRSGSSSFYCLFLHSQYFFLLRISLLHASGKQKDSVSFLATSYQHPIYFGLAKLFFPLRITQ